MYNLWKWLLKLTLQSNDNVKCNVIQKGPLKLNSSHNNAFRIQYELLFPSNHIQITLKAFRRRWKKLQIEVCNFPF